MRGSIVAIYVASKAGEKTRPVATAELEKDCGIVGDRYYSGSGTFSKKLDMANKADWHLTLIEMEQIDRFNSTHEFAFAYGDFRRNILTRGIELNALVGYQFRMGKVLLEGIRLCEPCAHLAALTTKEILPGMRGRAGLRARIVEGAGIACGDSIEISRE